MLQPRMGFNSGKYDQISPVVSERTPAILQAMERRAEQKHGFPSPLCKHGMALITDAYFGVTSEAACLLFVSELCFPTWAPASPRESTCKEYYSVLKSLSSQGAALSLLYASGYKVQLLWGELSHCLLFMFDILCRHFFIAIVRMTATLQEYLLKKLPTIDFFEKWDILFKKGFYFLLNLVRCFPEFLEVRLSVFDLFSC